MSPNEATGVLVRRPGSDGATSDEAVRPRRWPGLVAAAAGLGGALLAHRFVPAVGVLTWDWFRRRREHAFGPRP